MKDYSLNEFELWAKKYGHYTAQNQIESFKTLKRNQKHASLEPGRTGGPARNR